MSEARFPRLHPVQVCFVVDDVEAAVAECADRFGWGPFHQFSAPVPEARYHEWVGAKETDVALGMAGGVQVEHFSLPEDLPVPRVLEPGDVFPFQIGFQPKAIGQFSAELELLTGEAAPDVSKRLVGTACEEDCG